MEVESSYFADVSFGFAIVRGDFTITCINKTFSTILQQKQEYLLNKKINQFIPQLKEISRNRNFEFSRFTMDSGQTLSIDMLRNDNGYVVFCQDCTNYVQIMEQTEIANKRRIINDKMLDQLYDGCYITDGQGNTLYVNDAFLEMSGMKRETVVGKSVYQLLEGRVIPTSCAINVIETHKSSSTIIHYYKGRSCLVTGAPVFIDGKIERVILTSRDMTELQVLKDKLANSTSLTHALKNQLRVIKAQQKVPHTTETRSKSMTNIFDKAIKLAPLDLPLLILGETGVGKDFLVRFIHDIYNKNNEQCFITLNCGAIPEHLLESELFGYEPGAFTSASKHGKVGLFDLAHNGTLFLDEIGDMPLSLQAKLLNVLQEKRFFRVGGTKVIETNARIIAATNKNIEKLIRQYRFREDLYYRLNVINIVIPPLRNRKEDIIPLAMFFLNVCNTKYNRSCYFSPKVLELFLNYSWPGNIREIKNLIERLVVMSSHDCIEIESIKEHVASSYNYANSQERHIIKHANGAITSIDDSYSMEKSQLTGSLKDMVSSYECMILKKVLEQSSSLRDASKRLCIDVSTLVRKKQKYHI
jgi:PAS domain S-box-containing protein